MSDFTGFHEWHKSQSSKVMFIHSQDATTTHGETTDFTYVFRDSVQISSNEGILVSLLQASIPYSFYNVRQGVNDKIDIFINDVTGPLGYTEKVIQMPAGNYTAITMKKKFKALLEDACKSCNLESTVTIDYDRDLQKFQFKVERLSGDVTSSNPNSGRRIIFNLSHGQNKNEHFDVELGFDSSTASESVYFQQTLSSGQSAGSVLIIDGMPSGGSASGEEYLQSRHIADLNGSVHSLYLRSNLPVISAMDSMSGGVTNILGKLPIDVGPGGIIFHEPKNTVHKSLIQSKSVKYLHIKLTDDRNRVVSLNGLHFSIALMFEFVTLRQNVLPIDPRRAARMPYGLRGNINHISNVVNRRKKKVKKIKKDNNTK